MGAEDAGLCAAVPVPMGPCVPLDQLLAVMFHHLCLGVLLQWLLGRTTKLRHELAVAVELFLSGAAAPATAGSVRKKKRRRRA